MVGWIETAAREIEEMAFGLTYDEIFNVIKKHHDAAIDRRAAWPFVALPNPKCMHCGSSEVRNSSMAPATWICNDCGKPTEQ